MKEEKKARVTYNESQNEMKTTIKCNNAETRVMLKKYKSLKKEISEKEFKDMFRKVEKKIKWIKTKAEEEKKASKEISEEVKLNYLRY